MDTKVENRPRRGQSLESLTPSQIGAINRIPPHDRNAPPVIEARRPASIFLDPDYFELERQRIFRAKPVVIAPSARLPDAGSVLAHDGYGVPLLVTRDRQGVARVFLNACTHKGAILVSGCEAQKAARVTCPYHAWSFALDGRLVGVPREETYARFEKASRPLTELPSLEAGGLVWAILDPEAKPDFSIVEDQICRDFDSLGLPAAHAYGYRRFSLKANWKLVMEPFLEGYHVQRLHSRSIGPKGFDMFADVVGVVDQFGLHIRQTSGRGNFSPEVLGQPGQNIRSYVTHAYNIFPSTVVITSPYYTSVMTFMPKSVGETEVDYHMLVEGPPDNPKAVELYARSFEIIQDVFGNEDFKASESCQLGLASGAIKDVIYCGMEVAIPQFYQGVEDVLAKGG